MATKLQNTKLTPANNHVLYKLYSRHAQSWNKNIAQATGNSIDFQNTAWAQKANFEGFHFPKKVYFNGATFKSGVTFKNAIFEENVEFKDCIFEGGDWNSFVGADFKKRALFHNATFISKTTFTDAKFNAGSLFIGVTLEEPTFFQGTYFSKNANFTNAKIQNELSFQNTTFNQSIRFYGNEINDDSAQHEDLKQSYAKFKYIPDFSGSTLKGEFILEPSQLKEVAVRPDDKYRWAKLKLEMNRTHMYEEEIFYFSKELECRALAGDWKQKTVIGLYKCIADYGRSATKPFVALCILGAVMTIPYAFFYEVGTPSSLLKGINISLDNSFPFSLIKDKEASGFAFNLLTVIHKTFATTLLFLIGLGIRNRLRIK